MYEIPEKKYELVIKFGENFPNPPPKLVDHDEIKRVLGDFQLKNITNWAPEKAVIDIIEELNMKIQETLEMPKEELISPKTEEYITPDLNAYPPDAELNKYLTPSYTENEFF